MPRGKHKVRSNARASYQGLLHAAILYPALGTPEVLGDDSNLQILLLGPSDLTAEAVNRRIKIFSNYDSLRDFKIVYTAWLPCPDTLVQSPIINSDINLKHLSLSSDPVSMVESGFMGILSESFIAKYQKSAEGKTIFSDLWQVTVNLNALLPGWTEIMQGHTRFFLSWSSGGNAAQLERQQSVLHKVLLEEKEGKEFLYLGDRLQKDMQEATQNTRLASLACFDAVRFGINPDILISDYHPFHVYPENKHFNIGFISDLHLVTKFRVLRHSKLRAVPGIREQGPALPGEPTKSDAPCIGDMVLDTADTLDQLFRNAASKRSEVEALIVGGDLVDFFQDQYPDKMNVQLFEADKPDAKKKNWEVIWDLCQIESDNTKRQKNYQAGSSATAFFHMIVNFVKDCEKPIFVQAGNHDGYHKPFGISPRVAVGGQGDKEYRELSKANDGIPADCNLTVLEACLAFGPSYDIFLKVKDFKKEILDLFYLLYTPFRTVTCKLGKFQLALLDWGDDEDMLWRSEGLIPGHLPHANKAASDKDLKVLAFAVEKCSPRKIVLTSHYTWACYDPNIPINDANRKQTFSVKSGPLEIWTAQSTKYNVGSSRLNREKIFDWFKEGKIHYCISGHAHRAAVYGMVGMTEDYDVTVSGFHFEEYEKFQRSEHLPFPVIIVSDSAGPIPRENQGVLEGWGSNLPSYSRLKFDAEGNLISLDRVGCSDPRAKPRLAVALDYLEIRALLAYAKSHSNWPTFSAHNVDLHGGAMEGALAQVASGNSSVSLADYFNSAHIQGVKIFSALWGVPFDEKALNLERNPTLEFKFNIEASEIPTGLEISDSKLLLINKNSNTVAAFNLSIRRSPSSTFLLKREENRNHFIWLSNELKKSKGKTLDGYLSFHFAGNAYPYSSEYPWNIRVKIKTFQQKNKQIVSIFRDIRYNELPLNKSFRDECQLFSN